MIIKRDTYEETVKAVNQAIKALNEKGYIINAVSWFDETTAHINFTSKEEYQATEEDRQRIIQNIKEIFEKMSPEEKAKAEAAFKDPSGWHTHPYTNLRKEKK